MEWEDASIDGFGVQLVKKTSPLDHVLWIQRLDKKGVNEIK